MRLGLLSDAANAGEGTNSVSPTGRRNRGRLSSLHESPLTIKKTVVTEIVLDDTLSSSSAATMLLDNVDKKRASPEDSTMMKNRDAKRNLESNSIVPDKRHLRYSKSLQIESVNFEIMKASRFFTSGRGVFDAACILHRVWNT